jgi:hypothetical protein
VDVSRWKRIWWHAVRVVFGLLMLAGAATHVSNIKEGAMARSALITAMVATGYLWPLLGAIELVAALAILSGRFVPLALTMLAPVTLNILFFHLSEPSADGIGIALVIVSLHVTLAWMVRDQFASLLTAVVRAVHGPSTADAGSPLRTTLLGGFGLLMLTGGVMHFTIDPARWGLVFIDAMHASGYLWTIVGIVNIVAGAALLVRRGVPLMLLVLLPISVNVLLLHLWNPAAGGIPIGIVLMSLNLWLIWSYRVAYRELLHARASPSAVSTQL